MTPEEAVAEYLELGREAREIQDRRRRRREFALSLVAQLETAGLAVPPAPAPPEVDTPYMNVQEAAAYCRLSVQTLYNSRKELDSVPGSRRLIFTREILDAWLAKRR
jgi:hypothetical protein